MRTEILIKIFLSLFIINSYSFSQSGWIGQNIGTSQHLRKISFINPQTGWILGTGGFISKTTDGGISWNSLSISSVTLSDISFINEKTGWVVGGRILMFGSERAIFKTTNGGLNWVTLLHDNEAPFECCSFVDANTGWIGGSFRILKTTNGGSSFVVQPITGVIVSIFFSNSDTGYCCRQPYVFKTTNGGTNWINIASLNASNIFFIDNYSGYTVGYNQISRTTNAGNNWSTFNNSFGFIWQSFFHDLNNGYIVGGYFIKRTTDGGISWSDQITQFASLYSIFFVNEYTGWVCGGGGTVFKTTTGGTTFINQIESELFESFSLYQNYPNPFNPKTIINYELRITNHVNLKVYDIKGREIKTLVNKKQSMGNYKIEFDGTGLTSGVYFYSLFIDGDRIDTKKMIVLK